MDKSMSVRSRLRVIASGDLLRHTWEINDIHFSSNGSLLVSSSFEDQVAIWDVSEQRVVREIHPQAMGAHTVCTAVSAQDLLAVGLDSGDVSLWTFDGAFVDHIATNQTDGLSLAFSTTGHRLFATSENGMVSVWDVSSCKMLNTFIAAGSDLTPSERALEQHLLTCSPDGATVAIDYPSTRGMIQLWQIGDEGAKAQWICALMGTPSTIYDLTFSSDGRVLAAAAGGGIELFDMPTGARLGNLRMPGEIVNNLAFRPGDCMLAAAGSRGSVNIWDTTSQRVLATFDAHEEGGSWAIQDVIWAPNGKLLATCGWRVTASYRARSSSLKRPRGWHQQFPIRLWRIEEV